MNAIYDKLAKKYDYKTCERCDNGRQLDPDFYVKVYRRCEACKGIGYFFRWDIFSRAIGWDLWLCDPDRPAWSRPIRRVAQRIINPLVQVDIRRWRDVG